MKHSILLIVAALALAFTISTPAQAAPAAPVAASSAQVTAQLAALGITLPADQSAATIGHVMMAASTQNPMATPIEVIIVFAPNGSGVVEQESYPATTAQATAALAAGPALGVASPSRLTIYNKSGTFSELAR